ncbi:MAG: hypothetical protein ABIY51_02165 [Ferruginibacter sp.]
MKKLHLIFFSISILVVYSCNQNSNAKQEQSLTALSDSSLPAGNNDNNDVPVKLVKSASINLKVNYVEKASMAVSELARQYGGMLYTKDFHAEEEGRNELNVSKDSLLLVTSFTPHAGIIVRVPSVKLEEFLFSLSDIGYYTSSSSLHVDDKSFVFMENQLKNSSRSVVINEPGAKIKSIPAAIQKIGVKDDMINQQIANQAINMDVKYSTVSLELYQNALVKKEMIANTNIVGYNLPFHKRLSNSLQAGWDAFLSLIIALAILWAFIFVAVVVYLAYQYINRNKKLSVVPYVKS